MIHPFQDLQRLLGHWPWLHLLRVPYTERLLRKMIEDGHELQTVLQQYPAVRYEPLDLHYVCLQGIGALSPELFDDVAAVFGTQGRAWMSFHMMLDPQPWAQELIEIHRGTSSEGPWLEDIVLARSRGARSPYGVIEGLFDRLADQLKPLPKPATRLRRDFDLPAWQAHATAVKQAYKAGGADSALQLIREFEK